MKYVPPIGQNPDASYFDGSSQSGGLGSRVSAHAIEHPMREIVNTITESGLTPANDDLDQLTKAIKRIANPPGKMVLKAGRRPLEGTLLCNGSSYDPEEYPALFAAIGYTYGKVSNYFLVPNFQDRLLKGNYSMTNPTDSKIVVMQQDLTTSNASSHTHVLRAGQRFGGAISNNTASAGAHSHNLTLRLPVQTTIVCIYY